MYKNSTKKIKHKIDVESQTSAIRETSSQVSGFDTESLMGNQTWSTPVQCLNDSKTQQLEIQRNETDMTTYDSGDDNLSPPKKQIHKLESNVSGAPTNEIYMPLSSTIVLKRKKEMLYVPLDSDNGLTEDTLVDWGAYVSAIAQKDLDIIKQQAPTKILKIDD